MSHLLVPFAAPILNVAINSAGTILWYTGAGVWWLGQRAIYGYQPTQEEQVKKREQELKEREFEERKKERELAERERELVERERVEIERERVELVEIIRKQSELLEKLTDKKCS